MDFPTTCITLQPRSPPRTPPTSLVASHPQSVISKCHCYRYMRSSVCQPARVPACSCVLHTSPDDVCESGNISRTCVCVCMSERAIEHTLVYNASRWAAYHFVLHHKTLRSTPSPIPHPPRTLANTHIYIYIHLNMRACGKKNTEHRVWVSHWKYIYLS